MKYIVMILLVAIMTVGAYAFTPPPANGNYNGGWGMNPENWTVISGSWGPVFALYDPLGAGGGAGWRVWPGGNWIQYDPISIELWVEMYMVNTYHYTTYQYHRLGNQAELLQIVIEGTIASNNGQWINLIGPSTEAMTNLWFRHDVLDRTGSTYGTDLPITWYGRWGLDFTYGSSVQYGWTTLIPGPLGSTTYPQFVYMIIPKCDHWFQFEADVNIPYHVPDGYYSLVLAGCPAPEL